MLNKDRDLWVQLVLFRHLVFFQSPLDFTSAIPVVIFYYFLFIFFVSFCTTLFSVRVAGAAARDKQPHLTVFHHMHHFAWVKFQAIPSKILSVIGPLNLGRPTGFLPFALASKACSGVFPEAFCLQGQTI